MILFIFIFLSIILLNEFLVKWNKSGVNMITFVSIIGGIGFFLLGMNFITDGLKVIAGDTLRKWLNRFTGGTLSSITTDTVITLLVQSSTATT